MSTFRWSDGLREHGVTIRGETLEWWTAPDPGRREAGGGACEQTIEDFRAHGPRIGQVPAAILRKLRAALDGGD